MTGIKQATVDEEGISFTESMSFFEKLTGKDCKVLVCNELDMDVLQENYKLNNFKFGWVI